MSFAKKRQESVRYASLDRISVYTILLQCCASLVFSTANLYWSMTISW